MIVKESAITQVRPHGHVRAQAVTPMCRQEGPPVVQIIEVLSKYSDGQIRVPMHGQTKIKMTTKTSK